MNSDTIKLLERASECLAETQSLLDGNHYLGAVNRAYYTIFDCVRALLNEEGVFVKTHQGVHNKFNELFMRSNRLNQKYNSMLSKVFQLRQLADYDLDADLTLQDAEFALNSASEFLAATHRYFKA